MSSEIHTHFSWNSHIYAHSLHMHINAQGGMISSQLSETVFPQNLSEMMKAGLIEEMVNEALDSTLDAENVEEETEEEIEKVLAELVAETRAALPSAKVC